MGKRKRGNGEGSLFQRRSGGPWVASWFDGEGVRRERSTRTTSRSDAERIARKWVQHSAMVREGLAKPEGGTEMDRHATASVASHLEAFNAAKRSEGRTERHVTETARMIEDATTQCGWKSLGSMSAPDLERYVGRKLAPSEEGHGVKAWSPRTAHKYLTAARTFTRWCVSDGRLPADPLARIKKPAPTRQRERRMLQVEEWRWLKSVTETAPELMGMDGHTRRLLYGLAIETGLRSSELAALTRSSLALDGDRPHVLLEARQTKNRKAARQYVRPELAADLSRHVARLMPGGRVFTMPRRENVARMLRADLAAARAAWMDAAGSDAAERVRRERSDFLRAQDHDGRALDFHSLRHTTGSWAAIGGASPKAIQTLMRHSAITLTLDTYGHLLPDEAAETVGRMPTVQALPLRLTGTADAPAVDPATAGRTGTFGRDSVRSDGSDVDDTNRPVHSQKHGKTGQNSDQTERAGFEPAVRNVSVHRISNPAPSASRAPLQTATGPCRESAAGTSVAPRPGLNNPKRARSPGPRINEPRP